MAPVAGGEGWALPTEKNGLLVPGQAVEIIPDLQGIEGIQDRRIARHIERLTHFEHVGIRCQGAELAVARGGAPGGMAGDGDPAGSGVGEETGGFHGCSPWQGVMI